MPLRRVRWGGRRVRRDCYRTHVFGEREPQKQPPQRIARFTRVIPDVNPETNPAGLKCDSLDNLSTFTLLLCLPKCITLSATECYAGTSSQFELCQAACNPLKGNGLGMSQFGTPLPPEMRKTVVNRTISPLLFTADVTVQGFSSFIFILGFN